MAPLDFSPSPPTRRASRCARGRRVADGVGADAVLGVGVPGAERHSGSPLVHTYVVVAAFPFERVGLEWQGRTLAQAGVGERRSGAPHSTACSPGAWGGHQTERIGGLAGGIGSAPALLAEGDDKP
jgi:hypothetical protein